MLYQQFSLSEKYPNAKLTAYVCNTCSSVPLRPAVIVCPGGGYGGLSGREAEPVVRRFFGEGFNVFLLEYSVGEYAADHTPLIEASLAVRFVRERAELDRTNPEKIYILGFSAGGHLAAWSSIMWNSPLVRDAVGVSDGTAPEGINRPDGMILCYPVITAGKFTHEHSIQRLAAHTEITDEDVAEFSLELHVDSQTPPAFIWHTATDKTVPVENSILLAGALSREKVPFELHIFPEGPHGMSLCNEQTAYGNPAYLSRHIECWAELAVKWIKDF